jgi:hypothetical protein
MSKVDCGFIFGSSAEVERLWRLLEYIMISEKGMIPMLFRNVSSRRTNAFWNP